MNHLILFGILWCLAISIGAAQETAEPKEAGQTPTPAIEQPSPFRPAESRPVEPKRITLFPTGDARESEVAMKFIAQLEKEGFATGKVTELALTTDSPFQVYFIMQHDESVQRVKQFLMSLGDAGVERIFFETNENVYGGVGKNLLAFHAIPGYSPVEVKRIENSAVSAAESCELALSLGGTYVKSWQPTGESATLPRLRPVELKPITLFADVDGEPSETVMRFLADLERDGVAKVEVKGKASTSEWPIQLNFSTKEDESLEKIRQFIVALRQSGVEQIICDFGRHHCAENSLLFTTIAGYSHEEQQRIENAARTAAEQCSLSVRLAGTMVAPSNGDERKVAQLRSDYEASNKQAHNLAESLRQTPDAAKKAELRTAVQRTFTLRQSLLRAELLEMQTRLLQTQQSLDMRERIADQIVDRRVEDLLNPQLEWEQRLDRERKIPSELKPPVQPESSVVADSSVVTELEGDWHLVAYIDKWQTERRPKNLKIRANQETRTLWTGESVSSSIVVEADTRTIDFGSREAKNGTEIVSTRGTYELNGDVLTIHSEYKFTDLVSGVLIRKMQNKNIWKRGLCNIEDYDSRKSSNGMAVFYLNGNDENTGRGKLIPGDKVDVLVSLTLPNGTPQQCVLVEGLEIDGSSEPVENRERQMRLQGTREQCLLLQNTANHQIMSLRIRKPNDEKLQFPDGINRKAFKELDAASRNRDLEPTNE